MKPPLLLLLILMAAPPGNAGNTKAAADTTGTAAALARSRGAAMSLLGPLRTALVTALRSGGPANAVAVCADTAQLMTERIGRTASVSIRRVSTRWRNPLNEPDEYESAALARMEDARASGSLTDTNEVYGFTTVRGKRVFRYLRPIMLQQMCTACHGAAEDISPTVREVISSRYPDDHAVGYAMGDVRGAVSIILNDGHP